VSTNYFHPHLSGSIPAEAVIEAVILSRTEEYGFTDTREDALTTAALDTANVWGNIDPDVLVTAVLEAA
jgi:hypothetical protein